MVSQTDPSWHPFSSTSTSLIWQLLSPERMYTPTTQKSCMLMETDKQWKECSAKTWSNGRECLDTWTLKLSTVLQKQCWQQNCRQKIFNGGIYVFAKGIDIQKLTKTPLIHSVSYFKLGVLEYGLGGLSPPSPRLVGSHPPQQQGSCTWAENQPQQRNPFCSEPTCFGVMLARTLTYRRHLESLRKKLDITHCNSWGGLLGLARVLEQ